MFAEVQDDHSNTVQLFIMVKMSNQLKLPLTNMIAKKNHDICIQ